MITLVDTSVWVDHLRRRQPRLARLLERGEVVVHPYVIGELACGNLQGRDEVLGLLRALPRAVVASDEEVLRLVEVKRLHGRGLGWVDVHLLAAARLTGCRLWTADRRLEAAATAISRPSAP